MANTTIALRQSGATGNTPSLGVLANGELSINYADSILYFKTASNTLGSIRTTQPAGLTTEVQFNDAGSFGTDVNFTYNKTTDILTVGGGVIAAGINVAPAISSNATYANAAFSKANTANVTAEAAFSKANSANIIAQAAFDKANSSANLSFHIVAANGTNLVADANTDTLTITANTANGIQILANATTDTLDLGLKPTGVTSGTYGNSSTAITITIDQFGRVTTISQTAITFTESDPNALAFAIALG
jgi:hypothetical protein